MLGYSNGNAQYVRDNAGLVTHYDYYSETTASEYYEGGVESRFEQSAISQGEAGALIPQSSVTYFAHSDGNDVARVFPVARTTNYLEWYLGYNQDTTYDYTWHPGTVRPQTVTTTLPELIGGGYGGSTGNISVSSVEYDILGRARWMRDPLGYLTYAEYDVATAAMTLQIRDADTSQLSNQPVLGWTTPANGGQHVITSQEVDSFGRPTKVTTPGGVESYTIYNDANHEVRQYVAWDDTLGRPTGLTTVARQDRALGYSETIQMAALPTTVLGEPTGTETIGNVVSLSRNRFASNGQLESSDAYFNLSGICYSTAVNLGVEGVNYLRTDYSYGELGHVNRVESSDGSIARSVIDGLGRSVGEWIGSSDTVSGAWSPSNPGSMQRISSYEYDNGGVGNSNLTSTTTHTGTENRTQVTQYDWRGRPVLMLDGAGAVGDINRPLTYITYNNGERGMDVEVFDGDTHILADPSTFPSGVPARPATSLRRAWSRTEYDNFGRADRTRAFEVNQTDGSAIISTTVPTSWVTFDLRGLPMATGSPNNLVQRNVYDSLGQVTQSYLGQENYPTYYFGYAQNDVWNDIVWMQSEYTYDDRLNVVQVTSRERNADTYDSGDLTNGTPHRATYAGAYYDDLGRMTGSVDVGTNGGTAWTRPTMVPARSDSTLVNSIAFDDANRSVTITDPRGIANRSTSDALGRSVSETAAFGTVDAFTSTASYNSLGQLVSTTSPGNLTTSYGYDSLGRTKSVTDPAGLISTVGYNRLGEAITSTDPTGLVATTNLDALGRATSMSYANGGATRTMSSSYDVLGRTLSVTDPRGNSSSMAYHDESRYVESTDAEGFTSRTTYDVAGNTTKVQNPFNQNWTATYDVLNRLISSTDPLNHTTTIEHNRNGDRTCPRPNCGRICCQIEVVRFLAL